MSEFKVGDVVEVVDNGYVYSTYYRFFMYNDTPKESSVKFEEGFSPDKGTKGTIVYAGEHHVNHRRIYVVDDNEHAFLISADGIKKCENTESKPASGVTVTIDSEEVHNQLNGTGVVGLVVSEGDESKAIIHFNGYASQGKTVEDLARLAVETIRAFSDGDKTKEKFLNTLFLRSITCLIDREDPGDAFDRLIRDILKEGGK